MKLKYLLIFLFVILFDLACNLDKWDLDRSDFLTYESTLNESFVMSRRKNMYLDKDGTYLLPMNQDNNVYFSKIDLGKKEIQKIIGADNHYSYALSVSNDTTFIIENSGRDSRIRCLDKKFELIKENIEIFSRINSQIGLLDSLQLLDLCMSGQYLYACGFIKQTIGKRRSFVIKVNKALDILWFKTYNNNATAFNLKSAKNGFIYFDGNREGYTYIAKINSDGKLLKLVDHAELSGELGHDVLVLNSRVYHLGVYKNFPYSPVIVSYDLDLGSSWFKEYPHQYCRRPMISTNRSNSLILAFKKAPNSMILAEVDPYTGDFIWCNDFLDNEDQLPLDVLQTYDFGYLILSQNQLSGQLKLIKTDEEGATRIHPFSNQCN